MRTEFLYISVLRVASGPRVKLASCKSALNPPVVCSTDRSKAVVPVLVLLFVALWFILRGDLLYVFPCVILFLCFSVLLVLRLPRLGKRELILVLFVRLFGLCLFRFVGFLFLLGSGKGCGLWLWHFLDFSFFSSLHKMYRFRSSYTCAKYHSGLCSPFIHFIYPTIHKLAAPSEQVPSNMRKIHGFRFNLQRPIWAFAINGYIQ